MVSTRAWVVVGISAVSAAVVCTVAVRLWPVPRSPNHTAIRSDPAAATEIAGPSQGHDVYIAFSAPTAAPAPPASAAETSPTRNVNPFRYQNIPTEQMPAVVQADFEAEPARVGWSAKMERDISTRIQAPPSELEIDGHHPAEPPADVRVVGPVCKSTMCRLEIQSPTVEEFKTFVNSMVMGSAGRLSDLHLATYVSSADDGNGGRIASMYLIDPETLTPPQHP